MQKRISILIFTGIFFLCFLAQPVFALEESEVQAQVDAIGRDAVVGNVLVWFLCAIGFLKISQKIDSFMSSLGINVGNTGGSMLTEALLAVRGFGMVKDFSGMPRSRSSGSSGGNSPAISGTGALSGGLAGVAGRHLVGNAAKSVTTPEGTEASAGGLGGKLYASSLNNGTGFANQVIGSVATGSASRMGTITGSKAVEALNSYMGISNLEPGAKDVPTFSNVEIGGGRITGTETSTNHPEGIAFGMYNTEQYAAPEGDYTTVLSADGASWYKQYAVDAVKREPYMAPDGRVAYNESIIQKLPPTPKRKDRL